MSNRRRLLAVPVISFVILVLGATAASAHAVLEDSRPEASTSLHDAPRAITLTFTESVDVRPDAIQVYDDAMNPVDVGNAEHPDGRSKVVRAPLPTLGHGLYTVVWRAVSGDSHPIQGAFTFGIHTAATGAAADRLQAQALAGEANDRTVGVLFGVMRFGVFVGLALVLGIMGFVLFLWPGGRVAVRVRHVLFGALELTFVCTLVGFLLQGPYTTGGGLGDMLSTDLIADTWDTRFGKVWVLRLVLLAVMAVLARSVLRTGRGPIPRGLVVATSIVGIALAATPGLAGHASTGRWTVLALLMDIAHVLAMAVWLGGLVALGLARHDDVAYPTVAERFSGVALGAVVVLVISGTVQSVRQLQPISALWESDYGRILLAKLAAFAVLVGIAAWSRRLVHGPGLGFVGSAGSATVPPSAPVPEAVAPIAAAPADGTGGVATLVRDEPTTLPEVHPSLSRNVRIELAIAAVVLALTSMLVNTSPPEATREPAPVDRVIGQGATRFETFFGPAVAGQPNEFHVTAIDKNGQPKNVADLEVSLANPTADVPPIDIPVEHAAKGHYIAEGIRVPAGEWLLQITAFVTDVDSVTTSTDVTVG